MKANIEKLSGLQRRLSIEIPAEVVKGAFNEVYVDIQKDVTIKGFRKGKAPMQTIRSMYKDRVGQDVAQYLIQKHYYSALSEHKVTPVSQAEFEFDDPQESNNFSFVALFDVRPEVTLKKIDNLEVEKEKFEVEDSRIQQVITNILANNSKIEDVLEDRPATKGDISIIDFEGFVDGKPLENGTGKDHQLELGSNSFIEGFEEGIIGLKIGGQKTLTLKFPEPYHAPDLAGKAVEFKVKLNALKKKVLPELTSEFLTSIGANSDVDAFKKSIHDDIEKSEKKRIEDNFKNRLLKKLVAENPVEVPGSLLKDQKKALIDDFHKRMQQQGMTHEMYVEYVTKWDSDFEKTANEMIQSSFLIDTIAQKHDLMCKDEDLDKKFQEYAAQTGIELERIREFYSKPEQTSRLTYMITEEKVVEFLTKSAKIKEVPKSQLKDDLN